MTDLEKDFKNPSQKYRPIPFWSWNEKLDTDETKRQIQLMSDVGLGGYFMHARGGLQTEYMGKEWFDNVEVSTKLGKEKNMGAWVYDENGWPSGFGAGLVNGKGVKYQQKYLRCEKGEKHTETTIANVDGYHFFYEVNPFYVDLLDKNVTKDFINEIYVPYYEKYGNDIEGFFTDEPQLSRDGIPWSFKLEEEYKREYNENLADNLPHLFFEVGDYAETRVKFWRLVTKMFSESFVKQIYEWCDSVGLKFTGHMVLEESFLSQLTANGAVMPNYEYFHIPGMDCLGRVKIAKQTILQLTSVAQQLGKKQVLSETFALTGWGVSFEELKQIYEWQMVRGVNLLCTHLAAYSLRGIRKRDYPAAFSYQQPWWNEYQTFLDSVSRIGMVLSEGKPICDTLLIHPQTTAWVLYNGDDNNSKIDEYNDKFNLYIDDLEKKHVLFNLGDETIIEKHARVEKDTFVIGEQRYKTVVLPPHLALFESTKKLLKEFENNGGKVVTDSSSIKGSDIIDNPEITYTCRKYEDFVLHYFVNSTDSQQPVNIKRGTYTLNILTGKTEDFENATVIEPSSSLLVIDYGNNEKFKKTEKHPNQYSRIPLDGDWKIKNADFNSITLDYCKYCFDGEVIEENGPVISIQKRACELKRKVKVEMQFNVKVDYVPSEVYLVSETPEIFEYFVNEKRLDKTICGFYADNSFKMLNLAGYLTKGENVIDVVCDFEQSEQTYQDLEDSKVFETIKNKLTYDMEIENMYIVGDFAVETKNSFEQLSRDAVRYSGDFVITNPKNKVKCKNIEQQGFPFFAGKITLEKTFFAENNVNYCFEFSKRNANVVAIKINGEKVGKILWKPYFIDLIPFVKEGKENSIEITLINSLRNLLGPHHSEDGELYEVTSSSFFKEDSIWGTWGKTNWVDSYCFTEFGIE